MCVCVCVCVCEFMWLLFTAYQPLSVIYSQILLIYIYIYIYDL